MKKFRRVISVICIAAMLMGMAAIGASAEPADYQTYSGVKFVENKNGLTLGYHKDSGVEIIYDEASGYYFKDLNKNGKIDPYEDWRLSSEERAENLVSLMTIDKKLALKSHGGTNAESGLRFAVLRGSGKSDLAEQNNLLQMQCETVDWGIPAIRSSDPRHTGLIDSGWNPTDFVDTTLSKWPSTMALSNSMSEDMFYTYGDVVAAEYRAVGIQMQLGPQFDQITDPRWSRNNSCITEDYQLNEDLANAMVTAMQTDESEPIEDYGIDEGWGQNSVAAMAKHYPSSGTGEFGYEGHTDQGKFNVFPGDGYEAMVESFHKASGIVPEKKGTTSEVSSVMPCYSILVDAAETPMDEASVGEYTGGAFAEWLITDTLRGAYEYDGMVCTDWGIFGSRGWGLENGKGYTEPYRLLRAYLVGVDQAGGYGTLTNIRAAYDMGVNGNEELGVPALGEEFMNNLVDESCVRILKVIFNLGMFENPYCDPDYANAHNGSVALQNLAYEGHLESVVMLKNSDGILPIENKETSVYLPQLASTDRNGNITYSYPLSPEDVANTYKVAESADEADIAIVWLEGPKNGNGTAGVAQTCQFAPYTVEYGREVSIGGDWHHADGSLLQHGETPNIEAGDYKENRSVIGLSNSGSQNILDMFNETVELMGDKPIIAILNYNQSTVPEEFEPYVDAIVASSSCTPQAYLAVISGAYEPTGILSISMPANMKAVEEQCEDIPHDMINYVDADGNEYAFGFGLNYEGRIVDERTEKYIGLSAEPYSIVSAPEEVTAGIEFSFEIAVPSNITGVKLVNESGKTVTITKADITEAEYTNYWTISTKIGTPGEGRQIKILTKEFGKDYADNGLVLNLDVIQATSTVGARAKVNSAEFAKAKVNKNAPVGFTVKTNTLASKVKVFNEKEANMGKTLISRTSANGVITWEYEMSIGTKGERIFTAAAAKDDGVFNFDAAKLMTIEVI